MEKPESEKIQQRITKRLKKLRKEGSLTNKDFNYLLCFTRDKLYPLARTGGEASVKLDEIRKILD